MLTYLRLAVLVVSAALAMPTSSHAQDATSPSAGEPSPPATTPAQSPPPSTTTGPTAPPRVDGSVELLEEDGVPDLTLPHDLSPWGMFLNADIVVKSVMIGLAFASFVTWTVWLAKSLELAAARVTAGRALRFISEARSLHDVSTRFRRRRDPSALFVHAASQEVALSAEAIAYAGGEGLKERVASRLGRIEAQSGRRIARGTGVLATIGSTAPFVGLFGTVWGIMNAFVGISEAQTTNLAVVAPGIAEALLATALGLVAAIPAVVIYNVFARSVTGYRQLLADASAGVERLVSRDLDLRHLAPPPRAAE